MKLLLIDNFDSFTYNLVQYFGELGVEQEVHRNDAITPDEALARNPDAVVISPGPCDPDRAGVSLAMIEAFAGRKPILGVCLGHQCMAQHFGGKIIRADRLMHGKTSPVEHEESGLFAGLPNPFEATRYHSLVVAPESLPDCLRVTARADDGTIMGLRHQELPLHSVQFHPESLATEKGILILKNFLSFR